MNFFADNILTVILLPLWVSFIILSGLFFKLTHNNKITFILSLTSTLTCSLFVLKSMNYLFSSKSEITETTFQWFKSGNFSLDFGTQLDPYNAVILSVFYIITPILLIYFYDYSKTNKNYNLYCLFTNLICFAFSGLVLSNNLIQFCMFSIISAAILYFMLKFVQNNEEKQSFNGFIINNSIADSLLLIFVIILCYFSITNENTTGTKLLSFSNINVLNIELNGILPKSVYIMILSLPILYGIIKMAQFPFHTSHTNIYKQYFPINSLIIPVYSILTGCLLFIRLCPLFTEELLNAIIIIASISGFLYSLTAVFQNELHKVIAYICYSQLSLLLITINEKTLQTISITAVISIFSVILLYLTAIEIYKIFKTDNIKEISGVKNINFQLSAYWLISAVSLSGILFGGFTSKNAILKAISIYNSKTVLIFIVLIFFFTSYCLFKNYFRIFYNENKITDSYTIQKNKISSLRILSLFVILPGFMFNISTLNKISILTTLVMLSAVLFAYLEHKNKYNIPSVKLIENELYIPHILNCIEKQIYGFYTFIRKTYINTVKIFINTSKYNNNAPEHNIYTQISLILFYCFCIIAAALYLNGIWIGG